MAESISRRESSIVLTVLGNSDQDREVFTERSKMKVIVDLGKSYSTG